MRAAAAGCAGSSSSPGPGAYSVVDVRRVFKPVASASATAGFATSAQRFVSNAATPCAVGPGSYAYASSLVKPSYNVTLDA
jgi:hypothetical protein